MTYAPLYEDIINEIGTQTLARCGLNIFSLNTYGAYVASVKTTTIVNNSYDRHNKNPNAFGQYFEDLDVGQANIKSELFNTGEQKYTTDELADIKKVAEIKASGKKVENLNAKDREKYEFIMQNYANDVDTIIGSSKEEIAIKNHPSTDTVTFDKDGNIIEKSQHKVIKNTKDLLKDRYLNDNDVLTMPFDDYKKHKENLEKMAEDKNKPEQAQKAQKALEMLNKNNMTNRVMCENPRATAIMMQTATASAHVIQAGTSDAVVVALSSLANGAIYEIKDALSSNSEVSIMLRVKRLLKKILDDFYKTFKRGASYGTLDVAVGILSQIFKSISGKIKSIWNGLKDSFKSIYNAIYSFMKGEIKSYKDLLSTIIKGILSAVMVVGTVALEAQLEAFLSPLVSPVVAGFLAPAIAIIIGSIAVVLSTKSVDMALNALFGAFSQAKLAKLKAEKIEEICTTMLPELIAKKEELIELIKTTYKERKLAFDESFDKFSKSLSENDADRAIEALSSINQMYGKELQFKSFDEFDDFMLNSDDTFKL